MRAHQLVVLALLVVLSPAAALADAHELYVTATVEPSSGSIKDPVAGTVSTSSKALGVGGAVFYGLTNTWHLGVAGRVTLGQDLSWPGLTVDQSGFPVAATATGTVQGFSGGLLVAYRADLGLSALGISWAPVARVEAGYGTSSTTGIVLTPVAGGYTFTSPDTSWSGFEGRGSLLLEARFGSSVVASAGVAYARRGGGPSASSLSFPVSLGWIF